MAFKPARAASASLAFWLLCGGPGRAVAQQNPALISTGTSSGLRLFYPNSNDWWLDPSAGRLDLRVNGGAAPLAAFLRSGNIGIGTTNPGSPLEVKGSSLWLGSRDSSIANPQLYIGHDVGGGGYGMVEYNYNGGTNPYIYLHAQSGTGVAVQQGGNVGIGTANPSLAKLQVDNSGAGSITTYFTGTSNTAVALNTDGTAGAVGAYHAFKRSGTSKFLVGLGPISGADVYEIGTAAAALITVQSGGNVGIGTANPNAKLYVNGEAVVGAALKFDMNAGAGGYSDWISNYFGPVIYNTWYSGTAYPFQGAGNLVLQSRSDFHGDIVLATGYTTPTPRVVIQGVGGNVGIGTTSPGEKLEVSGGIKISDAARLYSPGSLAISGTSSSPTQPTNSVVINGGDTSNTPGRGVQIMTSDVAGTPLKRLNFDSGQNLSKAYFQNVNVGIGTTSPQGTLDVNGSICISGANCITSWPGATPMGLRQFVSSMTAAHFPVQGSAIPLDDTIPQITEGYQVLAAAIAPTRADSRLVIEAVVNYDEPINNCNGGVLALFDGGSNAIAVTGASVYGSELSPRTATMKFMTNAVSTASRTYSIRIGANGANCVEVNREGYIGGNAYGGTMVSSLTIMEVSP